MFLSLSRKEWHKKYKGCKAKGYKPKNQNKCSPSSKHVWSVKFASFILKLMLLRNKGSRLALQTCSVYQTCLGHYYLETSWRHQYVAFFLSTWAWDSGGVAFWKLKGGVKCMEWWYTLCPKRGQCFHSLGIFRSLLTSIFHCPTHPIILCV